MERGVAQWLWWLSCACVLVGAMVVVSWRRPLPHPPKAPPNAHLGEAERALAFANAPVQPKDGQGMVTVVHVVDTKDWLDQVADQRMPLIVTNANVGHWSAFTDWPRLQHWQSHGVHFLNDCRVSDDRVFWGVSTKPGLLRTGARDTHRMEDAPMATFWHQRDASQPRAYHSGPLAEFPEAIVAGVSPRDTVQMTAERFGYEPSSSVWLSQAGVVTQTHYDRSNNAYVQVVGRKQFELWPPQWAPYLHLFPSLHRHYHQSQVPPNTCDDVASQDASSSNTCMPLEPSLADFHNVKPWIANLLPGDVLYLPPYWAHRVHALDTPTISLSTHSPSFEEKVVSDAFWVALPFHDDWSLQHRVIGVHTFVTAFLDHLHGQQSATTHVRHLYETRWAPLEGEASSNGVADALTQNACWGLRDSKEPPPAMPPGMAQREVHDAVVRITAHLLRLHEATRAINVDNYVEEVCQWAVTATNVGLMLRECW